MSADISHAGAAAETPDFNAVYDEYFPFVWRTARRMGVAPSAIDDVCQDVFVAVHRRLAEFQGRSSLKTWLYGILMNVVQVHWRSLSRKSPAHWSAGESVDPETLVDGQQRPDEQLFDNEAARIAHALLDQLDKDKREVFVLVELEQMYVTEVAEATGVNLNTVYARLRAARKAFKEAATRYRAKDQWRLK